MVCGHFKFQNILIVFPYGFPSALPRRGALQGPFSKYPQIQNPRAAVCCHSSQESIIQVIDRKCPSRKGHHATYRWNRVISLILHLWSLTIKTRCKMESAASFNVSSGRQSVPERLAQLGVAAEISVPLSPGYIGQKRVICVCTLRSHRGENR